MSARAFVATTLLLACVGLIGPGAVSAQDIEAVARMRGLTLSDGYYERIRRDPGAFEFSNALFRRTGLRPGMAPLAAAPARTASEGIVTLPVVLALFSDSPTPHITQQMIDQSLFTGPAEMGTVSDAYLEMSLGALEVRGEVFPWVRTSVTRADVAGPDGDGLGGESMVGEYLTEALDSLDAGVDFSQYDNDGPDGVADSGDDDGIVDVVTFEYLEVAASCGFTPSIWPHRWSMTGQTGEPYETDDTGFSGEPILVNDYITQSVADCSGQEVQDASTIAHEFGHALGLPDFYHPTAQGIGPEGRRWVMGCWALMAGGAWGCGRIGESRGPFGPTHMQAHSKNVLGWLDYFDVGEVWNEEVVLDPVQTSGMALRIPLGNEGTEFFLAEYRAHYGFDEQLPADGVIMYKQDLTAQRRPDPQSNDPYFITLLEQDGDGALVRNHLEGGDRGVPGDAWGVAGVSSRLNAETVPSLRLSNGAYTPVMVHEAYVEGGQARLVISTGQTPQLVPPTQAFEVTRVESFMEPVRIAGGTGPYTGNGVLPDGVFLTAAGDELFVAGSLLVEGPFQFMVSVTDALGSTSNEVSVDLSAPTAWTVQVVELLQTFLQSAGVAPLTQGEMDYLDSLGNQNGIYDVGDLRRALRGQLPQGN